MKAKKHKAVRPEVLKWYLEHVVDAPLGATTIPRGYAHEFDIIKQHFMDVTFGFEAMFDYQLLTVSEMQRMLKPYLLMLLQKEELAAADAVMAD